MHSEQTAIRGVCAEIGAADTTCHIAIAPRQRGQGLVEYVLIILFVALAVALALSLMAPTINSIFRALPPAL